MRRSFKIALLLLLGFFSILMIRISFPYLAFNDTTAFLRIKQFVIHNPVWKASFYVHVITSSFCLLAGFTQFSKYFLHHNVAVHRNAGKLYVIVILFLSGPSGFIMSLYANGGLLSQFAFISLSVLWWYFTYQAYVMVRAGNYLRHRDFMIRSYALTLSAVTLRAWKFLIVLVFRPQPMDAYMIVAWLGWIPNLIIAEWLIRTWLSKNKSAIQDTKQVSSPS